MPARPKKQHYVTKAYLDGFLDEKCNFLFCYGRHKAKAFRGRTEEFAHERSYYSFRKEDGTWDDSLEHEIEKHVEVPGLNVIHKLSTGNSRLSWPERDQLAMLVATQRLRVPYLREMTDAAYSGIIQKLLLEYDNKKREDGLSFQHISPISGLRDKESEPAYVSKKQLENMQRSLKEDPGQFSRETLFDQAFSIAKIFRRMKWTIIYSNENAPFVTSDCPVLQRHEQKEFEHAALARPDTRIEFPLSRTALLLMTHDLLLVNLLKRLGSGRETKRILKQTPEIRVMQADQEQVNAFNSNQALYCSRWLFSGRQNDWVIKTLQDRSRNVRQRLTYEGGLIQVESLAGE